MIGKRNKGEKRGNKERNRRITGETRKNQYTEDPNIES